MGVMWRLFKKDLKAVTAFPRFEILLFISAFTFVGMSITIVWPLSLDRFIQTFNKNFSWFLTSFVFLLAPLMVTDIISGEYERGTLLTLISYPVKRFEVLTAKLAATYLFSSIMLAVPFLLSISTASSFNGLAVESTMMLSYFVGLIFLNLILCSVAVAVSVLSRRLIMAALAFLFISIGWIFAIPGLAATMNLSELSLYAYTETVKNLISLLLSPDRSSFMFSREQILGAVAFQLLVSASCLGLAYWFFQRREFK